MLAIEPGTDAEFGNQTTKQGADQKNAKHCDYQKSVAERMEAGEDVKSFQNKQRIHLGRLGSQDQKHRQRNNSTNPRAPAEPYSKLVQQREEIKESTNKVNCFVDENEPVFINSMARTMDAFDLRMSTFGGRNASAVEKQKNFDKFIAEKRGFIRTTNCYKNNDPMKVLATEQNARVAAPGPAFKTSYDNKYNQRTVFATDAGRVKQALNANQQSEAELIAHEKTKMLDQLKCSNFKFENGEAGTQQMKDADRARDRARLRPQPNSAHKLPMQTIGEVNEHAELQFEGVDAALRMFNTGKRTVSDPRMADYESG